jgi:peroxiredoxin
MHLDTREKSPDSDGEEQPTRPRREVRRKPGKEAGEKHVVAGGEAHPLVAMAPKPGPEVQKRGDDGHVGLPTVRRDDQRPRFEAEAPRAEDDDAKGRVGVGPHPHPDGVVERPHVDSMARMARLALGDPAPPFELPAIDGKTHSLDDFPGQPVAVVFSCVHCPYVVAWEDRLNDVARDYGGRAGLVAVNSNAGYLGDGIAEMKQRSEEKDFAFPFLYDETQEVASTYGAARTPEVFLFDGEHRLAYHGTPDSDHQDPDGADPYLRRALDAVLDGGEPDPAEVPPVGCTIKWRF